MIDWIKVDTLIDLNQVDTLLNRLDFKSEINELTAELTEWPKRYKYDNLKFVLIPAEKRPGYWLEISGSLHRFWEGGTNYHPFSYSDLRYTIKFLSFVCQIAPSSFTIKQLEFGVNLTSSFVETQELLSNLLAYKNKMFTSMRTSGNKEIGLNATFTDYRIKIYDKALQFSLPFPVCRVEMQIRQHTERMVGISTLAALLEKNNIDHLGTEITKKASQLIFDDPFLQMNKLRPSQQKFINLGRNPREYKNFTPKQRKHFSDLIQRHGTSKYAIKLSDEVANNWKILIGS